MKPRIDSLRIQLDASGGEDVSYKSEKYITNIFAMGSGVEKLSAKCKNHKCVITVSRTDNYTDPEDKYQIEKKVNHLFLMMRTSTGLLLRSHSLVISYTLPKVAERVN